MRHRNQDKKLGRSPEHRAALLASLVCNLIHEKRIRTTLAKAKLARRLAERMVTVGRRGSISARRVALVNLRQRKHVAALFTEIVPKFADRKGGYTRIVKLGQRRSDGSEMAVLEWVGIEVPDKGKKKPAEAGEKKAE